MCEFLLKQRDSQYRWWSTLSRISNKEWQYWVNLASLSQVPITKLKNPIWLKCRDTNRRHPLAFFTIFPLSIRAVKPLLPQVPAHALSTRPRFNKDFYSHARTECTAPGLKRWHTAGSAGSQAHLGKGYSLSPGYPTAQRCQGAKGRTALCLILRFWEQYKDNWHLLLGLQPRQRFQNTENQKIGQKEKNTLDTIRRIFVFMV